jgi:hypothetical protein
MIRPLRRGAAGCRGVAGGRGVLAGLCAAGLVVVLPATAWADVSTATATAAGLEVLGTGPVSSGRPFWSSCGRRSRA